MQGVKMAFKIIALLKLALVGATAAAGEMRQNRVLAKAWQETAAAAGGGGGGGVKMLF